MKQFNDSGHWARQKSGSCRRLLHAVLCCVTIVFALFLMPANAFAQAEKPAKITGKVTSTAGTPLAGVTITVEGTYRGAFTTVDGAYAIDAKPGEKLKYSFIE